MLLHHIALRLYSNDLGIHFGYESHSCLIILEPSTNDINKIQFEC